MSVFYNRTLKFSLYITDFVFCSENSDILRKLQMLAKLLKNTTFFKKLFLHISIIKILKNLQLKKNTFNNRNHTK